MKIERSKLKKSNSELVSWLLMWYLYCFILIYASIVELLLKCIAVVC